MKALCASPRQPETRASGASSMRHRAAYMGSGPGRFLDETSPTNPQTAYAHCKVMVERDLDADGRRQIFRRLSAQRDGLRALASYAFRHRAERPVCAGVDAEEDRDGERWQPLAPDCPHRGHLRGHALCSSRRRPLPSTARSSTSGRPARTFASGRSLQIVAEAFPGCEVSAGPPSQDNRSYRVSFDKIASKLPGYHARWTAAQGRRRNAQAFRAN